MAHTTGGEGQTTGNASSGRKTAMRAASPPSPTGAVGRFGVSSVRVFGSVARSDATEGSDVDLLIDVPTGTGLVTVRQITDGIMAPDVLVLAADGNTAAVSAIVEV